MPASVWWPGLDTWGPVMLSPKIQHGDTTTLTDGALAEELNCFFARFEVSRPTTTPLVPPTDTDTPPLEQKEQEVRCVSSSVNPRKAAPKVPR